MTGLPHSRFRDLAAFLILLAPLSWYGWILSAGSNRDDTGLNPLGPLVAAALASLVAGRQEAIAQLRRILRVRVSWRLYAVALLLPVIICLASVGTEVAMFGGRLPTREAVRDLDQAADAFLFILLFVALGEEPAWRGWLTPRLQQIMAPWKAVLIVAPVWSIWHLPLFGRQLPLDQIGPFVLSLTGACMFLAWLTNSAQGGVLPAMLCHATVNAIGGGYLFQYFSGAEKTRLWWIYASLWMASGLVLLVRSKGHLGQDQRGPSRGAPNPFDAHGGG